MIYTLGDDTSFWNGPVDFIKMKAAGAKFVYIRVSWLYEDSRFREYWSAAKEAGLLRGAYHYLDWRGSEMAQANLFTGLIAGDGGELPPLLDLEMDPLPYTYATRQENGHVMFDDLMPETRKKIGASFLPLRYRPGEKSFTLQPDQVQGKTWNWLQAVEKATGRIPMIYSGYFYWRQWMTDNKGWLRHPFMLAWYAAENIIKVPSPWVDWTMWQWTGNGNGPQFGSSGLSMDMDWFHGTEQELQAFAQGTTPIPVPPPPVPAANTQEATCNPRVRSSPDASTPSNIIGMLNKGDYVVVDQTLPYWKHIAPNSLYPKGGWVWGAFLTPLLATPLSPSGDIPPNPADLGEESKESEA